MTHFISEDTCILYHTHNKTIKFKMSLVAGYNAKAGAYGGTKGNGISDVMM